METAFRLKIESPLGCRLIASSLSLSLVSLLPSLLDFILTYQDQVDSKKKKNEDTDEKQEKRRKKRARYIKNCEEAGLQFEHQDCNVSGLGSRGCGLVAWLVLVGEWQGFVYLCWKGVVEKLVILSLLATYLNIAYYTMAN